MDINILPPSLDPNEEDDALVASARLYIETRERCKTEALTDPERTPTPQLLATLLNVTLEELLEIQDFAENELGEYEAATIYSRARGTVSL